MDSRERDRVQRRLEDEIKRHFPEGPVQRVLVLQYGDSPAIEPGELLARVFVTPPPENGSNFRDPVQRFEDAHRKEMKKLRTDLSRALPEVGLLEFTCDVHGNVCTPLVQRLHRTPEGDPAGGDQATPVMARLGADDLETLDTLINAGIATSRADAVRWALARIRERPAYGELRQRAQDIERLKTQF